MNTVESRYLEYSISRTLDVSDKTIGPILINFKQNDYSITRTFDRFSSGETYGRGDEVDQIHNPRSQGFFTFTYGTEGKKRPGVEDANSDNKSIYFTILYVFFIYIYFTMILLIV